MRGLNVDTLLALLEHFTSAVPCLVLAIGFRFIVQFAYPEQEDSTRQILLFLDDSMVVGVIVWLIYQLGVTLWNRRQRIDFHAFMVA